MEKPHIIEEIYEVFKDYYGEDKVDLRPFTRRSTYHENVDAHWMILIHWPEVTITNEYDESVIIWHLYGKILIGNSGKLMQKPLFNRTEYNQVQWNSDYAHSHLCGINKHDLTEWRDSCLGSGPINQTISKLQAKTESIYINNSYISVNYSTRHLYTDMDIWSLFVWELDKYVHVESVAGTPYRYIKDIGVNRNNTNTGNYTFPTKLSSISSTCNGLIKEFFKYIISSKVLKFNYYNGSFNIGMSFIDTVVLISNMFIEWYNNQDSDFKTKYPKNALYTEKIVEEVYIIDGKVLYKNGNNNDRTPLVGNLGKELFIFKDNIVRLTINGVSTNNDNTVLILGLNIIGYMIYKILRFVNCKYGKAEYTISSKTRIF